MEKVIVPTAAQLTKSARSSKIMPGDELEEIAAAVKDVSDGMKKLKSGRLNDKALLLLISNASGVPQYQVERVLDGMQQLERKYLK